MGKKIVLAIFGGIALVGVLLMITGFALGGRVTNMTTENGRVVLDTGSEKIDAGAAPLWMSNLSNFVYWADNHRNVPSPPSAPHAPNAPNIMNAAEEATVSVEGTAVSLPFSKADVKEIDIDIDAGYVIITEGTEFSLTVNGPISYKSDFSGGEWKLTSDQNIDGLRTEYGKNRFGNDMPRFYQNGRDVTTEFYITVPKGNYELEAELGIGYLSADSLDVRQLSMSNDLGLMVCDNTTANTAEFKTDLGDGAITGFSGRVCELKVSLGHIAFYGEATELFTAECDLGSIEATVPHPDDYGWNLEADLGHVSLDGHTASGLSSANSGNAGAKPFFDLKAGIGSVDVMFTGNAAQAE